jgi:hypothetical protein
MALAHVRTPPTQVRASVLPTRLCLLANGRPPGGLPAPRAFGHLTMSDL